MPASPEQGGWRRSASGRSACTEEELAAENARSKKELHHRPAPLSRYPYVAPAASSELEREGKMVPPPIKPRNLKTDRILGTRSTARKAWQNNGNSGNKRPATQHPQAPSSFSQPTDEKPRERPSFRSIPAALMQVPVAAPMRPARRSPPFSRSIFAFQAPG